MPPSQEPQFSLVSIPELFEGYADQHKIRALQTKSGHSKALKYLAEWKKSHSKDYSKILQVLTRLAATQRVREPKLVSRGTSESGCQEIFEIKSGKLRLFGFYFNGAGGSFFILTHGCLKPPQREQDNEFKNAEKIRLNFLFKNKNSRNSM